MTHAQTARLGGVVLLTALFASGCGTQKSEVKGKVLYRGQVVPSGSITFLAEDGQKYYCAISDDRDHTYTMRGVPPGKVRIAVKSHPRAPAGLNPSWAGKAPGKYPSANVEKPDRVVDVPLKYEAAEKSGIVYEVLPGSRTHNIELPP
jgi:hypothetical protein